MKALMGKVTDSYFIEPDIHDCYIVPFCVSIFFALVNECVASVSHNL